MPRKYVNRQSPGPYHISCRSINKEWFSIPMDQVWEIFSEQLYFAKHAFNLEIHSFVLMSNHYHLLVSTPDINLSEAMAYFQREVSRQLNRDGNRINRTFGSRYRPCLLENYHYYMNTYKYIYQNPLRAKICKKVEEYPYSTLHGLLGQNHLVIPVSEDTILLDGKIALNLKWLNTLPDESDVLSMRRALKRGQFQLPKSPVNQKPNRLETILL